MEGARRRGGAEHGGPRLRGEFEEGSMFPADVPTNIGELIASQFDVTHVLAVAGPIFGAVAVIALGLSIGPKYGLKLLGWVRRIIH